MTDLATVVKLDDAGHVCAVTRAPRGHGKWIEPPPDVARAPFEHRLCPQQGWVRKTDAECAEFDARHELPEPPAAARATELRAKLLDGSVTQAERDEALALLLGQRA